MSGTGSSGSEEQSIAASEIPGECGLLGSKKTRGDLGTAIAAIVLVYSPRDLQQMRWNFAEKIRDISPTYRKRLEETITEYLHGTYQNVRQRSRSGFRGAQDNPEAGKGKEKNAVIGWRRIRSDQDTD